MKHTQCVAVGVTVHPVPSPGTCPPSLPRDPRSNAPTLLSCWWEEAEQQRSASLSDAAVLGGSGHAVLLICDTGVTAWLRSNHASSAGGCHPGVWAESAGRWNRTRLNPPVTPAQTPAQLGWREDTVGSLGWGASGHL